MKNDQPQSSRSVLNMIAIAVAAIVVYSFLAGIFGEQAMPAASAQSDRFLEQRINQIEQRFYSLESRLNRIESATRPSITAPTRPSTRDSELEFLRTQIDGLRFRLG